MNTIENIILIDDNRIDNLISKKLLKRNGFTGRFQEFTDPTAALNYLIRTDLGEYNKDKTLVILDINMPVINGFELLYNFHQQNKKVCENFKIVMLSSSCSSSDIEYSYNNELISDYIIKPLTPEKVAMKLSAQFRLVA